MKNLMQQQKIKNILKEVDAELERLVNVDDAFVRECALNTIRAGGKRLRPIFVILSAQYFGVKNEDIVKFASIMELVHTASLIHDDVNDNSDLRRGRPTINATYDNNVAVHIGVYILIEALKKVYEVPHTKELLQILTHTAVEMARGEVAQLASMFDTEQTIESYNYRIERKTALLIAICCQTGAILSDASPEEVDAFYRFGHHLGMAFQIKDDILDVETLGCKLMELLAEQAPQTIVDRYSIAIPEEECDFLGYELLQQAGRRRGFLLRGGEIDTERMARILLDEFRGGVLGRITLEKPE